MATERQLWLLELTVAEYLKTGQPVSSATVLKENDLKISSATIRNDFKILEDEGYLEKGYKKAGRVPTNKGYEYYINNIKTNEDSSENVKRRLKQLFDNRKLNNKELMEQVLEVINESTSTLAITQEVDDSRLIDMKIYELDNNKALVVAVASNGKVNNVEVDLEEVKFSEFKKATEIIFNRVAGVRVEDASERTKAVTSLVNEEVDKLEDRFQGVVTKVVNKLIERTNIKYTGVSNVVNSQHLNSKKQIKAILHSVETNSIWDILDKSDKVSSNNSTVSIDMKDKNFEGVAAVDREINYGDGRARITIIGSKNQEYEKIFSALDYLEDKLKE